MLSLGPKHQMTRTAATAVARRPCALALGPAPQRSLALPIPAVLDEELVRRIADGDRWAEEAFYRRYVAAVYGTVRRLLGSHSDAEDVVQDTFATAFAIWKQLRDPLRAREWLLRIAVRKVHRRFRTRRLMRALGLDRSTDEVLLDCLAPESMSGEARAELAILDSVLTRLPSNERLAWMLRYVEGFGLEEVAEQCGCSLATAKRRIAAAHAVVQRHVTVLEPSDG